MSVLSGTLLLAGLPPAGAGEGGRVKGRVIVDKEPVADVDVTLSAVSGDPDASDAGEDGVTNQKGRFSFRGVAPGRYKLNIGLAFEGSDGDSSCKTPGFTSLSVQGQDPSGNIFTLIALESKKAFRAKAGETVTRNLKIDCTPDATLADSDGGEPDSTGGDSDGGATGDPAERAFLAELDAAGLSGTYSSDEEAVAAGRRACDDYRVEVTSGGGLDPFDFDFNLLLVAIPHFCPDLQQYVTEVPGP